MSTITQANVQHSDITKEPTSPNRERKWLYWLAAVVVVLAIAFIAAYPKITEEIAYVRGMEAYVYGFPLVIMDVSNGVMTAVPKSGEYHAPINQFFRIRTYVSPDYKDVVRISRNSLWSVAVLDLDREPVVVSHPDTNGRFKVVQMLNMWTDDFGSVGSRTTGTGAGNFLVAGPKWNGTPPPDVKDVFRCSTRNAWILVQIAAKSPEEFPAINAMQDQLKITPLSAWGKPYTPPDNVPVDPTVDTTATPFEQLGWMDAGTFFNRLAHLLKDNPPYPADAPMIEKLKKLGIEPGQDFDIHKVDPNVAKGLNRVPAAVWAALAAGPYQMKSEGGWLIPTDMGRYGTDYDTRALIAWGGLGALTSDDCIYPSAWVDSDGNPLVGTHNYVMHFPKGEIFPSFSGVWSISPDRLAFYVHNPIERYGILSSSPVKYNEDGSLDIYLQARSPGADKESNWQPIAPSGPITVVVRVYQPKPEMLNGRAENNVMVGLASYSIPRPKRVD